MDFSEIYFHANEQLLLKNLLPIDEEHFNQIQKGHWEEAYQDIDFEEWKEVITQYGYDTKRIKRNSNRRTMRQYFYEGEYITSEINTLDPSWLSNEFTIGCLKADEFAKEMFEGKNYTVYFFSEQNLFAIDYFHRHYKKIAKEDRYEAFKNMYVYCNYGFELFDKDVLSEMFSLAENQEAVLKLKENGISDSDYLTIYRGMGERSTRLENAYSWTLSLETAQRFAHHFSEGQVYKGRVKVEDILDYITERNEEEIWVTFSSIEDIELIEGVEE